MVGASRVHYGCDQLLVQVLPIIDPLPIVEAEAIDRALDWDIQHLQLLLEESLLAPISLFHKPNPSWNALLICARHPAAELQDFIPMLAGASRRISWFLCQCCLLWGLSPECDTLANALKGPKLPRWCFATLQL